MPGGPRRNLQRSRARPRDEAPLSRRMNELALKVPALRPAVIEWLAAH